MLTGMVKQDGVGPDWQMVLPLVMTFDGNQEARTSVRVSGPSTPFEIKVPHQAEEGRAGPVQLGAVGEDDVTREVDRSGSRTPVALGGVRLTGLDLLPARPNRGTNPASMRACRHGRTDSRDSAR